MADPDAPLSHDAHYLAVTAHSYGWDTTAEPNGDLRFSLLPWALHVKFWHDGGFRFATASGPESTPWNWICPASWTPWRNTQAPSPRTPP